MLASQKLQNNGYRITDSPVAGIIGHGVGRARRSCARLVCRCLRVLDAFTDAADHIREKGVRGPRRIKVRNDLDNERALHRPMPCEPLLPTDPVKRVAVLPFVTVVETCRPCFVTLAGSLRYEAISTLSKALKFDGSRCLLGQQAYAGATKE